MGQIEEDASIVDGGVAVAASRSPQADGESAGPGFPEDAPDLLRAARARNVAARGAGHAPALDRFERETGRLLQMSRRRQIHDGMLLMMKPTRAQRLGT